jgi:hypothetical protein
VLQAYGQLRQGPYPLQYTLQPTHQGTIQRSTCGLTPQSQRCSLGPLTDDPQRPTHPRTLPGLPQQYLPRPGQRSPTVLDQNRTRSPPTPPNPRPHPSHHHSPPQLPCQTNNYDCGIFVLAYQRAVKSWINTHLPSAQTSIDQRINTLTSTLR